MVKKITKKELKALDEAGVSYVMEFGELQVAVPEEGEFNIERLNTGLTSSDINYEETERHMQLACETVPSLGGFKAGWGGWILKKGYVSIQNGYDYCDTANPIHY